MYPYRRFVVCIFVLMVSLALPIMEPSDRSSVLAKEGTKEKTNSSNKAIFIVPIAYQSSDLCRTRKAFYGAILPRTPVLLENSMM